MNKFIRIEVSYKKDRTITDQDRVTLQLLCVTKWSRYQWQMGSVTKYIRNEQPWLEPALRRVRKMSAPLNQFVGENKFDGII